MAKFSVCGTMFVDVQVYVEADTLEDAIELASSDALAESYANETVGVEIYSDDIELVEVNADSSRIEWAEEWCEEV